MTDFYMSLRAALADGIDKAEAEGRLPVDTLADMIRMASMLCIVKMGEADTLITLRGMLRQLEKEYPHAKAKADEHFARWDRPKDNA